MWTCLYFADGASALLNNMFSKLLVSRFTGGSDCSDSSNVQGIVTNLVLQKTGNCKRVGKAKKTNKSNNNNDSPTTSPPPTPRTDSYAKVTSDEGVYYVSQTPQSATASAVDWSQYYARNNGLSGSDMPSSSSPVSSSFAASPVTPSVRSIQTRSMQTRSASITDSGDSSGSNTVSVYQASSSSLTKSSVRGTFNPRTREEDP